VLQYSLRRQVAGKIFTHDITIVQLAPQGGRSLRELRDYALNFSGLTATSGYTGAAPGAPAQAVATGSAAAAPPAAGDPCAGQPSCQAQGPFMATVVRVNVTDTGRVTADHLVRTTVRFKNLGDRPLILGYRVNTNLVTDNQGHAYTRITSTGGDRGHVFGIGVVTNDAADPQFQLAPGESREASFEADLQYNVRYTQPGNVFSQDMTIAELSVIGPNQVRTVHDYALSFTNLTAGNVFAGGPSGAPAAQTAEAIGKVVDLFKAFKK
jgi:hypothetical protein